MPFTWLSVQLEVSVLHAKLPADQCITRMATHPTSEAAEAPRLIPPRRELACLGLIGGWVQVVPASGSRVREQVWSQGAMWCV
jgi:hypothetical protein